MSLYGPRRERPGGRPAGRLSEVNPPHVDCSIGEGAIFLFACYANGASSAVVFTPASPQPEAGNVPARVFCAGIFAVPCERV